FASTVTLTLLSARAANPSPAATPRPTRAKLRARGARCFRDTIVVSPYVNQVQERAALGAPSGSRVLRRSVDALYSPYPPRACASTLVAPRRRTVGGRR